MVIFFGCIFSLMIAYLKEQRSSLKLIRLCSNLIILSDTHARSFKPIQIVKSQRPLNVTYTGRFDTNLNRIHYWIERIYLMTYLMFNPTVCPIWIGVKSPGKDGIQGSLWFYGLDGCCGVLKWVPQNSPHVT